MLGFSPLSTTPLASNEVQFSSTGNASGSIAPINLSAPTGSAKGKASASGSIASISLVAPNGAASNSGSSPAFASGSIRAITLTAPNGSAAAGSGNAYYPTPNLVLFGVQYGPNGNDYTGEYVGATASEIAAAVWAHNIP